MFFVLGTHHPATIPAFAIIAGLSVGQTDISQAERHLGRGQVNIGGHPGGARSWFDRNRGIQIYADGFYYCERGELIDKIRLSWPGGLSAGASWPGGKSGPEPVIKLSSNAYGFWSKVKQGMSQGQFLASLPAGNYKLFNNTDQVVLVSMGLSKFGRRLGNKDNDRFETWRAEARFERGRLDSILITAD